MMQVPATTQAPAAPPVDQKYLLMAAAVMAQQSRDKEKSK